MLAQVRVDSMKVFRFVYENIRLVVCILVLIIWVWYDYFCWLTLLMIAASYYEGKIIDYIRIIMERYNATDTDAENNKNDV